MPLVYFPSTYKILLIEAFLKFKTLIQNAVQRECARSSSIKSLGSIFLDPYDTYCHYLGIVAHNQRKCSLFILVHVRASHCSYIIDKNIAQFLNNNVKIRIVVKSCHHILAVSIPDPLPYSIPLSLLIIPLTKYLQVFGYS